MGAFPIEGNIKKSQDNKRITIALVGNPNCGKTTLFNVLTGARQKTGNWAGVTVEKKTGHYENNGMLFDIVDLPGSYSLDVGVGEVSLDEKIARDYILSKQADVVVNILDAANIERNLYLTTQLLEMRCPVIVVLNMMDTAKDKGIGINIDMLRKRIGCPVIPVIASSKQKSGVAELKESINEFICDGSYFPANLSYSHQVEGIILKIVSQTETVATEKNISSRWLAIKLLEGDSTLDGLLNQTQYDSVVQARKKLEVAEGEDADIIFANERYEHINLLTQAVVRRKQNLSKNLTAKIDSIVLNRYLGIPIFLLIMYCMFTFAIKTGQIFQDVVQQLFEAVFVNGLGHMLGVMHAPGWFIAAVTGAGEGVATVANFVPLIAALFLFLALLEDTGYMARAAFIVDILMKKIGLPGKSFVPLIVGFGCNVPAIMATRTLQRERDRKLSVMMNPFISCGARLQVFSLLAMVFFPHGGQNVVFALYLLGIVVAVFTGLIMKKTLLPGKVSSFVMELPVYHMPTARVTLTRTWDKLKGFVIRAGRTIVLLVMVITALNTVGRDGSLGNEDTQNSLLSAISQTITPVFKPMGMKEDNWPATVGIFTGVLAKETVAGTLNAVYGQIASKQMQAKRSLSEPYSFWGDVKDALKTVPDNIKFWASSFGNPFKSGDVDSVSSATKNTMYTMFGGIASVFAYMIFVLLYVPCVAAMGAVKREVGKRWMYFSVFWTTYMAYTLATLFYQIYTFALHPVYSLSWIGGLLSGVVCVIFVLRYLGNRMDATDKNTQNFDLDDGRPAYVD